MLDALNGKGLQSSIRLTEESILKEESASIDVVSYYNDVPPNITNTGCISGPHHLHDKRSSNGWACTLRVPACSALIAEVGWSNLTGAAQHLRKDPLKYKAQSPAG